MLNLCLKLRLLYHFDELYMATDCIYNENNNGRRTVGHPTKLGPNLTSLRLQQLDVV